MAKSRMQTEKRCYVCKSTRELEEHHIFGAANRKNSEKYGLKVHLCRYHHNQPPNGVHHNKYLMRLLHQDGQAAFERDCGNREEFMKIFGRNYLDD